MPASSEHTHEAISPGQPSRPLALVPMSQTRAACRGYQEIRSLQGPQSRLAHVLRSRLRRRRETTCRHVCTTAVGRQSIVLKDTGLLGVVVLVLVVCCSPRGARRPRRGLHGRGGHGGQGSRGSEGEREVSRAARDRTESVCFSPSSLVTADMPHLRGSVNRLSVKLWIC